MSKFLAVHHERCLSFDDIGDAQAWATRRAAHREHWRIVADRTPRARLSWLPETVAALGMCVILAAIVIGFNHMPAWPEETYSAIVTDASGEAWIIDYRLSADDCDAYRAKYGAIECRAE
jgi:hypothetical protein